MSTHHSPKGPTGGSAAQQSDEFLKSELQHAWTHYRHLETIRTTYIGYYVTVLLGTSGWLVTQLKDGFVHPPARGLIVGLLSFGLVLFGVAALLMMTVIRIGFVLATYEDLMISARHYFYGGFSSQAYVVWDIRKRLPEVVTRQKFRIQGAAEYLGIATCCLVTVAEFAFTALLFYESLNRHWDLAAACSCAMGTACAITMSYVLVRILLLRKKATHQRAVIEQQIPDLTRAGKYLVRPQREASIKRWWRTMLLLD